MRWREQASILLGMARTSFTDPAPRPTRYAIEVDGHLDGARLEDLGCTRLQRDAAGMTVLEAEVPDQAALHGILARLRDLGIPLLALTRLPAAPPSLTPITQGAPDA